MSVPYRAIVAAVAVRCNALVGATATALQTTYATSPLTTANFQSSIFPYSDVVESVLWAEERLAMAIAQNGTHPWRQYLADVTTPLANLSILPAQTNASLPIIGTWGAVVDSGDLQVCSLMPLDEVRRRVRNANSNLSCEVYWYNIAGGRIEHTRTNVVIDVCGYSRTDQLTELNANGIIALADVLEPAYVAGAISMLVRDDEFSAQSQIYASYFQSTLAAISENAQTVAPLMEVAA